MTQKRGTKSPVEGIHPRWISGWKRLREVLRHYKDDPELALRALRHYAETGVVLDQLPMPLAADERAWEDLRMSVMRYAAQRLAGVELAGVEDDVFDGESAATAFAAAYTSWLMDAAVLNKLVERRHEPLPPILSTRELPFVALGIVLGARPAAEAMARAQLNACRKGYYENVDVYPLFQLMLKLLADHFGEPAFAVQGAWATEPSCAALYEVWKAPDAQLLKAPCLAICDVHTQRTIVKSSAWHEYDNVLWNRIPIEVLLLFKLRQIRGLANPDLDHPLMNGALGRLPPETGFRPDELLTRVRDRMVADGFDEARILGGYGVVA